MNRAEAWIWRIITPIVFALWCLMVYISIDAFRHGSIAAGLISSAITLIIGLLEAAVLSDH